MHRLAGHRGSLLRSFARVPSARNINIFQAIEQQELDSIPIENIRNFSVIAHIDHGKSTLSDSLLQLAGNISEKDKNRGQVLDTLQVERERGITVKAQTASMIFEDVRTEPSTRYLVNLIDTPGHIDFCHEVARSLSSCQGALLLVDSTQSIQAQTLANHSLAVKKGLAIVPVVTKIDLPNAAPEDTALIMATTFNLDPNGVIMTSAKRNIGIKEVFLAVVDMLPSPKEASKEASGPLFARIVDSWFDEHRGVVCLVQVVGGSISEGQRITTLASVEEEGGEGGKSDFSVQEVGVLTPSAVRTRTLRTGQVGYVISGMRSIRQARSGDTMYVPSQWSGSASITALSGYEPSKPMIFASVFPVDSVDLDDMFSAVDRLSLNDSSISVSKDHSNSLGSGLRIGFLGFLHMEVFNQRLADEFNMRVVVTTPSVPYRIEYADGTAEEISSVAGWPEESRSRDFRVYEPMVKVVLVTPVEYYGAMVEVLKTRRSSEVEVTHVDGGQVLITCLVPWQEVVCDMNDAVKNLSSGYASFNYSEAGYAYSDLVKVEVAINGEACDPLSFITHRSNASTQGRAMATKLKTVVARQQFEIVVQARIGVKVLAKERIAPYRKDVLIKSGKTVGGGDLTRKKKLLEKQKEGKKRSKMVGKVEISQEAFWSVLQR